MRQILASFSKHSYEKFVKTMSSILLVKKQKYFVKWIEVKTWIEKTLVKL